VVVGVEVEVVGVSAGGPTVSEQDATTRQTVDTTRASLCLDTVPPLAPFINKTPVKVRATNERRGGSVQPRLGYGGVYAKLGLTHVSNCQQAARHACGPSTVVDRDT
jgi:hypothetical protein